MKPSFALNFADDAIGLLHRTSRGWMEVGVVPLDEPDLVQAISYLRGSALGLVMMGTSLGGILIPQLARPLIEKYNWRVAMLAVSMLIWFVLLPAIWLVVRVHPRELGLEPDGAALGANDKSTRSLYFNAASRSHREDSRKLPSTA